MPSASSKSQRRRKKAPKPTRKRRQRKAPPQEGGQQTADAFTWLTSGPQSIQVVDSATYKKISTTDDWDSTVYSSTGYAIPCFLTFSPAQNNADVAVGLSENPSTSNSLQTITYAINLQNSSQLQILENNVVQGTFGNYNANDSFTILFDGNTIQYFQNGNVLKSTNRGAGPPLSFVSSFKTTGAQISTVSFGPLDLSGPAGQPGAPGQAGIPGTAASTGATGPSGPVGLQGRAGPSGRQGLQGDPGIQGVPGATGGLGPTGAQGLSGAPGEASNTGATGARLVCRGIRGNRV